MIKTAVNLGTIIPQISGKVYPDHWFSVGKRPREKKRKDEKRYDKAYNEQFDSVVRFQKDYRETTADVVRWLDGRVDAGNPWFTDSSESSQENATRYGTKGITRKGKRSLRGAAAILQRDYGKHRLGFCTLTIPNFYPGQIQTLAEQWNEVLRIFFQRFKRRIARIGAPLLYAASVEIQEGRWNDYKVVAPHIHFVYVGKAHRYQKGWNVTLDEMREDWKAALLGRLKKSGNMPTHEITWDGTVDGKRVRKDVIAYLGKYMSKGVKVCNELIECGLEECLPRQWWTMSACMRSLLKKNIKRMDAVLADLIYRKPQLAVELGIIKWYKEIYVPYNDKELYVGVCGYLVSGVDVTNYEALLDKVCARTQA